MLGDAMVGSSQSIPAGSAAVLDGSLSFDADHPLAPLTYAWTCTVVSTAAPCSLGALPLNGPVLNIPPNVLPAGSSASIGLTVTGTTGATSSTSIALQLLTGGAPLVRIQVRSGRVSTVV